ncbi:MAG: histidine phosphatase family protein [Caldilineaceae bacterium]|nr:histidine phosphatase family protein [Caldilineaceae bacterium]
MDIQLLRTVWLLRHGQESRDRPQPLGGYLSDLGRQQAELTAQRLAEVPFTRIVASTLHRATQTAQIVAARHPHIEIEYTEDLWECAPSAPPGQEIFFPNLTPEAASACRDRLDRAFDRYFRDDGQGMTLLVAHGNVIRYLLCRVLDMPIDAWARFDLFNCSLARVDWKTVLGRQVTGFNDVGHLPWEMQTYG